MAAATIEREKPDSSISLPNTAPSRNTGLAASIQWVAKIERDSVRVRGSSKNNGFEIGLMKSQKQRSLSRNKLNNLPLQARPPLRISP
mgnify:CR=1 FL=1